MQSDVRDVDVLLDLLNGLARLGEGFEAAVEEIRAILSRVDEWIRVDRPAYWQQQLRLSEQALNSALDYLQQKRSTTRPGDRPPASEAQKRVAVAKQRVKLCQEKHQACRRHLLRLEGVINAMAGPLTEIDEAAGNDLPRAMAELKQLIKILDAYGGPRPDASS
ncbi:hypothetical protein [Roseimaritima ulvae]|uniref:Uncharacterized protein n=1 Tax=Roseimaritima ulvae TaxID=980254 RepID=A0A5B9QR42_9BACT|nr:hypothetical protein [Roseimaritima ulvae]QEG39506.1 hypothetical protein UC8_15010 [Roseimaritima ulvae]